MWRYYRQEHRRVGIRIRIKKSELIQGGQQQCVVMLSGQVQSPGSDSVSSSFRGGMGSSSNSGLGRAHAPGREKAPDA